MKRVVDPAGYTIVETMIFLAVSAALFVSASALITGRQRRTQFATTVREFSSKIQSVYGNVASGYYNSTGNVTCTVAGNKVHTLNNTGNAQGTNGGCEYLGQVVVSPQAQSSNFQIISLVGVRRNSAGQEVSSLMEADPTLYTATADTYSLAGAEFLSVKADNSAPITTGSSVAFIGSLASFSTAQALQTGSGHTDTYVIPSDDTTRNMGIEDTLVKGHAVSANTISYCLSNGDQTALVKLEEELLHT